MKKADKTTEQCETALKEVRQRLSQLEILQAKHKQMEEALKEGENRYERLVGAVTDYIYTVAVENGRAMETSHGAGCVAVTGYTSEEYEKDPFLWHSMIHEEDRKAVMDQTARVLSGEDVPPLEHRIMHKDGSIRWVRNTPVSRRDEQGHLVAYDGLITDITEHKKADEFIKSIFENIGEGLVVVDREYTIITANKAYCNQVKMPIEDIIGRHCYEISHHIEKPCYKAGEACPVRHTFEIGQTKDYIHTHYDKEENPVYVEVRSYPMKDVSGKVIAAIEVITDITKTVTLEKALQKKVKELQESEERFRKISVTAQDAIIMIDNEGNISYWNPASEKMFGYREEEGIGKDLHELIVPGRYYEKYLKGFERFKETGQGPLIGKTIEVSAIKKDGTEFPIELSLSAVKLKDKWNGIGIIRDITKRKLTEEKIKQDYHIQSTINSILKISLEPISLEEQLERILDLILSIPWISLESKGCIYLVEDDPEVLVSKTCRNYLENQLIICCKVPFGKCLCGQAASTGELLFVDCVDDHHEIRYPGIFPHGHYCVPIRSGEKVLGIINLYVREGHRKNKEEEEFLLAVANTLAGVIKRKQAEDELRRYKEHLEELVKERTEALNKQRENFISVLIHDLKGPLVPVLGYTKRLIGGKAKSEEDRMRILKIIQEDSQDLLKIIEHTSKDLRDKLALQSFHP